MKKRFCPRLSIGSILLICASALVIAPSVFADYTPQTATRFVADADSRESNATDRTPLILIHGFTGTDDATFNGIDGATAAEKAYFAEFLDFFYSTASLNGAYDLYRFHYLSNVVDVPTIAADLRLWFEDFIASGDLKDGEFVLIGHSMGGLVSRSYMEEQTHDAGTFAGEKGGERVKILITLGTPHHGSPAANDAARDPGPGWDLLLDIVDTIFWRGVGVTDPNRSDLKWDNYNNMTGYGAEQNEWLFNLNGASFYSDKIIAYGGGVEDSTGGISDGYSLKLLWEQLENSTPNEFSGLFGICESTGRLPGKNNFLSPFKGPYDNDRPFTFQIKLCFAGVLLDKIYDMNSDGLVPADSADYRDGAPGDTRWFEGFDHWDLKSDREVNPKLFAALEKDLDALIPAEKGDVDKDRDIDLADAILCLKIVAGLSESAPGLPGADVDGDEAIGLIEGIFALRSAAASSK